MAKNTVSAGARLSFEQWQALRWLASPTAYASAGAGSMYESLGGLVRRDTEGRWRSTAAGRKALVWRSIWAALERAESHGYGFLSPDHARRLSRAGIVVDVGGPYPTLERVVTLTDAGRAMLRTSV